jgi:hypothetical protein
MTGGSLGQVGLTPAFMPVMAEVRYRRGRALNPDVCPSGIFVQESDDRIEVYQASPAAGP